MGRTSFTGPLKSTAGFEIGAGGSEATATNTAIIDSSGNATIPGTLAVTGTTTLTGAIAGPVPYALKADDYTVTAAESGTTFGMATNAKTFTLPAAAAGLTYTFVNTGAATNNNILVDSGTVEIFGTFTLAGTVVVADQETLLTNTQGTSVKGDSVTLVSDGTAWFIIASTGIWAATAP